MGFILRTLGLAVMFLAAMLGLAVEPKPAAVAAVIAVAVLGLVLNLFGWGLERRH